jgi:hypothetical protein
MGDFIFCGEKLKKKLLKKNILHIEKINSIDISFMDAQSYIKYVRSDSVKKGFPYVISKSDMI